MTEVEQGDEAAAARFVEVSQAYEVLSDKEKKETYDKYGEEGLKRLQAGQPASGFHDARDVFSRFFGGGGGGQQQTRKGPQIVTNIEVDLETIYTGQTLPLTVNRKALCPSCDGSGARKPSDIVPCAACGGGGVRLIRQQLGPGMFVQQQATCSDCGGRGKRIAHLCPRCRGHRVVDSTSELDLHIDRGMAEGAELVFEGEADESPDWEAGDVVVRVRSQARPGGFARKGEHLYWRQSLSLAEALLGFEKDIQHLDGHTLTLRRTDVTQPGHTQVIEQEGASLAAQSWKSLAFPRSGMPHYHLSGYGNLFVTYDLVLPATISPALRKSASILSFYLSTDERAGRARRCLWLSRAAED